MLFARVLFATVIAPYGVVFWLLVRVGWGWEWFVAWSVAGFFASLLAVALLLAPAIGLIAYLLNKGDAEAF